ncbi:MAG TPA: calcium/sodium antiporter [Egibacteraceae bacterium]|nr:calcium/sodium antiporter [Egibacteraceae bacterium]
MLDVLLLIGGLGLLTVAADRFVIGAARLSTALRISPVIVGAIVIGFGTSTPEFLVTVLATLRGSQDLAFGNIVGSNTANVLLVLGAAGVARPLMIGAATLRRELPLMLLAVLLLAAVSADGRVSALDAAVLLAAAAAAIAIIVVVGLRDREAAKSLAAEVAGYSGQAPPSVPRSALLAVVGLLGTLLGAQMLVSGAVGIARALRVSEAVIGLTIVAVGTSLPELVTAIAAARRDESDLVVGNILGSNLFNSLPVAGVAGALATTTLGRTFLLSLGIMVVACGLAAVLLRSGRRLVRGEAALLLVGFVAATIAVAFF